MNSIMKFGAISIMGFVLVGCATSTSTSTSNATDEELSVAKASLVEQTDGVSEWKTAAVKVSDGTEKICRRTQQTGTRFKTKVCMTQAEWDNLAEQSKRVSGTAQRRSSTQNNPSGG